MRESIFVTVAYVVDADPDCDEGSGDVYWKYWTSVGVPLGDLVDERDSVGVVERCAGRISETAMEYK